MRREEKTKKREEKKKEREELAKKREEKKERDELGKKRARPVMTSLAIEALCNIFSDFRMSPPPSFSTALSASGEHVMPWSCRKEEERGEEEEDEEKDADKRTAVARDQALRTSGQGDLGVLFIVEAKTINTRNLYFI
jgi:hypothetical protein